MLACRSVRAVCDSGQPARFSARLSHAEQRRGRQNTRSRRGARSNTRLGDAAARVPPHDGHSRVADQNASAACDATAASALQSAISFLASVPVLRAAWSLLRWWASIAERVRPKRARSEAGTSSGHWGPPRSIGQLRASKSERLRRQRDLSRTHTWTHIVSRTVRSRDRKIPTYSG